MTSINSITSLGLGDDPKPKTIASKMQAMFMEVMLKTMEESVEAEGGLFGDSAGSEIYRGMFREQLAAAMSNQLQSPLRKQLEQELEIHRPTHRDFKKQRVRTRSSDGRRARREFRN